ncbi:MAG: thioredoxin family protein [Phycisphaerales bacterium]
MIDPVLLKQKFDEGLEYEAFVASGAPEGHDGAWRERYERCALTPEQTRLVAGFEREMRVLCLTGTWCGDCALQGAAMQRVAEANDRIQLRFLGRNDHADLQVKAPINAGFRVPVTWFLDQDFEVAARFGDRTLSRYRSMARKALGDQSGVIAEPPADPVREVLREVLDEFERVSWLLRLNPDR